VQEFVALVANIRGVPRLSAFGHTTNNKTAAALSCHEVRILHFRLRLCVYFQRADWPAEPRQVNPSLLEEASDGKSINCYSDRDGRHLPQSTRQETSPLAVHCQLFSTTNCTGKCCIDTRMPLAAPGALLTIITSRAVPLPISTRVQLQQPSVNNHHDEGP